VSNSTTVTRITAADVPVVASAVLGGCLGGFTAGNAGSAALLPSAVLPSSVLPVAVLRDERPTEAPVAADAAAEAYAAAFEAAGAGADLKQKQHHTMWPFRGHEPWRDPA
jgi:hypothetical protein